MYYSENIRQIFIAVTIIVLGSICMIRIGYIDLGYKIGEIADNPKNRDDADYKIAVLNALKKMDKSITLQELNEKLTKQVAEPDLPDEKDDVDE